MYFRISSFVATKEFVHGKMASNIKKVFGIMNKKKPEDSDEDVCAYTDPAIVHSTEPPSRNSRGFSQPHYPPPRPQHSPNPRRKVQDTAVQGNRRSQANGTKRNSAVEPRRAPPRPNIAKKDSTDDDYCDPIDAQRKDDFLPDKNKAKDDYCEPWDSTTKTDFGNVPHKKSQSDDELNEYMDPYDTGKDGIFEKRWSRGIGKDFGVQPGKLAPNSNEQQKKSTSDADSKLYDEVYEPRKTGIVDNDYDMPWEWKKQMQMSKMKVPKPKPVSQNQRPKNDSAKDNYDEPWENKQGYMLKNQLPTGGGKPRSPVPLPRVSVKAANQEGLVYEQPRDSGNVNPQENTADNDSGAVYETPWEEVPSNRETNGHRYRDSSPRRASQPAVSYYNQPTSNRKLSQPAGGGDYDTPWEYKNAKKFPLVGPPKPARMSEDLGASVVNPDLLLDDQSWYHGPLKRLQAEELLRDAPDCSFLVRNSESSKKDFSLSMKNNDNFLHLKIVRQLDGQFILGQFSKPFMDIPKVIHYYSVNKLNIRGAEHKILKHPVASQPEYHTIEPEEDTHV